MQIFVYAFLLPVVLAGAVIVAGWAVYRWAIPDYAKDSMERGEYGHLHAFSGAVTGSALVVWLFTQWRHLCAWLRSRFGREPAAAAAPVPAGPLPPIPAAPPSIPPADLPDDHVDLGEVAAVTTTPIPPDRAAVISRTAGYEPEDDAAFLAFMQEHASAFLGLAEAFRSFADTCLNGVGLDPTAVQGTVELADVVGDTAHDVTLARRRFLVTYAATLEAIGNGLVLPFRARDFLTGEGA